MKKAHPHYSRQKAEPIVAIVIPARYASTRLPGKPLVDILGKPMIQRVHERALAVPGVHRSIVATDDKKIFDVVRGYGGECLMTSAEHESGTERLIEVMRSVDSDIYVNLQGDEPLVRPEDIAMLVAKMKAHPQVQVATLCHRLPAEEVGNPNAVKVVRDVQGDALYFSRAPIPFVREAGDEATAFKHVGIYAYRRSVLERYPALARPEMEQAERLEQLRLLANGIRIRAFEIEPTGPGVDTPDDLAKVIRILQGEAVTDAIEPAVASRDLHATLAATRLIVMDVDGVLTDGRLYYTEDGETLKAFHARDGLGIAMLHSAGIRLAALSGRNSKTLRRRLSDLKIDLFCLGEYDKGEGFRALIKEAGVRAEDTLYIGDDVIDLAAFDLAGACFAVADAMHCVKDAADVVLQSKGGDGALRELAEMVLSAQGLRDRFSSAEGFKVVADFKKAAKNKRKESK